MNDAAGVPTLRSLSGVVPAFAADGCLARVETAVVLIDYQREYEAGPLALPGVTGAGAQAQALRHWADDRGLPVIHVLHHARTADAPLFAPGSRGAEPIDGLAPAAGERVVIKHWPSAFVDTGLAGLLTELGTKTLVLAGFMTHNCIDSTARDAFHRGFRVAVVADASATRDLPGPDGRRLAAADVHAAVLASLGDRIAEVVELAGLQGLAVKA